MKHFLILVIVLVDFHLMAWLDHFTFSAYVTGVLSITWIYMAGIIYFHFKTQKP